MKQYMDLMERLYQAAKEGKDERYTVCSMRGACFGATQLMIAQAIPTDWEKINKVYNEYMEKFSTLK